MSYIRKLFEKLDIMDDFLMNALVNDSEIREVSEYEEMSDEFVTIHNKCDEVSDLDYDDGLV